MIPIPKMIGSAASHRLASRMLANHGENADLVREAPGAANDYGEWVPGVETTTTVRLVSTPISGREREMLPEGLRLADVRRFYLRAADITRDLDLGGDGAVRFEYRGITYRSLMVQNWGGFWEVYAVRPEPETGGGGA